MFKRKITAFLMSIILFVNIPLLGFTSVYADDGITASNPLLMPLTGWLTAVAIGTGIIGKNVTDSANQLISNVANNLKEKEIQKSLEDENYNSPFMVIPGGSDKTPQKPNNNNKNGAWFALGTATAGASAMFFEKGAMETAMQTFNDLQAYQKYIAEQGLVSADTMLSTSSASGIALQLANIGNTCVSQFNNFLHSSWWNDKSFTPDDCLFAVGVYTPDFLNDIYPYIGITIFDNSQKKVKNLRLLKNPFGYYTTTYNNKSLSYYYYNPDITQACMFLDENNAQISLKSYVVSVDAVRGNEEFTESKIRQRTSTNSVYFYSRPYYNPYTANAYCGYKWTIENPWGLTNNVYNVNQTFDVNFPDWQQGIMEILGQQLQGVQIGGITQPNVTWNPTQEQIQTGSVPQNVITQYINNYQNPESIPEDELNPEPEPDPNPNPNPEPEPEPVPESALDTGAQSLWEWAVSKIVLPSDIWDKVPFSIPYDMYLLIKALFPTGSSKKRMLRVSKGSTLRPDGITISSNFEAYGQNTRQYNQNNRWTNNAPIINLDLHFTYHDVSGNVKTFDYVKVVDLGQYGYFAMIIYIGVYIVWMGEILVFIKNMF